jgi:hypothetical protein
MMGFTTGSCDSRWIWSATSCLKTNEGEGVTWYSMILIACC